MRSTQLHQGTQHLIQALERLAGREARHAAARLYPHAAGDAEFGASLGRRLRRGIGRRCRGLRGRTPSHRQESARLGRRLRHARACRSIAPRPRARSASSSTHEPVTAVQLSRGKAEAQLLFELTLLMGDLSRLAADLLLFYTQEFAFIELPRCLHDRLIDHAAEAQPGRVRAGARPQRHGARRADRGTRDLRQAAVRLPARPAAAEVRRCFAASTPPNRRSTSWRRRSMR